MAARHKLISATDSWQDVHLLAGLRGGVLVAALVNMGYTAIFFVAEIIQHYCHAQPGRRVILDLQSSLAQRYLWV